MVLDDAVLDASRPEAQTRGLETVKQVTYSLCVTNLGWLVSSGALSISFALGLARARALHQPGATEEKRKETRRRGMLQECLLVPR